jgi:hypothetical protein
MLKGALSFPQSFFRHQEIDMNRLQQLRSWFSLDEVAQRLSLIYGVTVSAADVIRACLDGVLTLSVRFLTPTKARPGFQITDGPSNFVVENDESLPCDENSGTPCTGEGVFLATLNPSIEESEFAPLEEGRDFDGIGLVIEKHVVAVNGIHDVLLVGDALHIVERKYQAMIGGPEVTREFDQGIYVKGDDGAIYQLQENFDVNVFDARRQKEAARLRQYIDDNNMTSDQAKEYIKGLGRSRQVRRHMRKKTITMQKYMPACRFPPDSSFVVRAESVANFIAKLNSIGGAAHSDADVAAPASPTPLPLDAEQVRHAPAEEQELGATEPNAENWKMRIQAEATSMIQRGREHGAQPTVYSIIGDLARWCVKNNVRTANGIHPSAGYIRAHVLSSKYWKAPKWEA